MCNNSSDKINNKDVERAKVGRFGNCQRTAGRCKAVVRTQPEVLSGVVGRKVVSRPNRVRPLQRRSIKPTLFVGGSVLDEVAAVTLQRNKVVTRKLPTTFNSSCGTSRPYVLMEIRRGVFYYSKFWNTPAVTTCLNRGVNVIQNLPNSSEIKYEPLKVETTRTMRVRGVRGAISVTENTPDAIYEATAELVRTIFEVNDLDPEDVASIFFTTTRDLDAAFPAMAVRKHLGYTDIPLMCSHEMDVANALPMVVRVLLHVNTTKSAAEIKHVYLREAVALRPDKALTDKSR